MDAPRVPPQYPPGASGVHSGSSIAPGLQLFWRRITDGMRLGQMWDQLRTDVRTTYRLYSREITTQWPAGVKRRHRVVSVAKQFFWAILEKLTPARRVLLLAALVLLLLPVSSVAGASHETWHSHFDGHVAGALLLLAVLLLELTDRVIMKRDLQIAKDIQGWLLPARAPQVPGLQIAFATIPANTVAGDYYDVFPRRHLDRGAQDSGGETFLIAIADVAGKSIPAAMLMATTQASLRTLSRTPGSISDLVARMNSYACSNSQDGRRFTTAFIAEYEPSTRILTYVNAGHNPPLLRRCLGVIETLEEGGLPLGIIDGFAYSSAAVTLQPGDLLAAFTDGVVEAQNQSEDEYGEDRFRALLQLYAAASPDMILGTVLHDIRRFVGTAPQHDDVTLMLMKAV